ncbi:MAG: hypothetical protein R2705_02540 [Ilumatobacteraceae bacterium]
MTATCYRGAEYAGILRGTDHPEAAGMLLDALVSADLQAELPLTNFVYPARTDVELPGLFAEFAPRPTDALVLDQRTVAARESWIETWTDTVLR